MPAKSTPDPGAAFTADAELRPGYWVPAQVRFVRHAGLSAPAKVLYLILCSYAGEGETAWPGRERLAAELPCDSLRTVDKYLGELVSAGLLTVTRRGLNLTNLYHVHKLPLAGFTVEAQTLHPQRRKVRAPRGATLAPESDSANPESGEGSPPQIQAIDVFAYQAQRRAEGKLRLPE